VHPIAGLIGRGAPPKEAAAVIWGSGVLAAVTAGLWFVDTPVAEALLIVIAISAPRALLGLVARWSRPGVGETSPGPPAWPALRPPI
jgi:hypothetical protein